MTITVIQPSTGKPLRDYEEHTPAEVEKRLALAAKRFASWKETPVAERAEKLAVAARLLRERKDRYARLMAEEMGKLVGPGEAEVEKCASGCEFYAARAASFLAPEPAESDARESFVRYDPLGPVLAIMPWNFPYWQTFRCALPAVMAGNTVALKHASNVTGCALATEEIWREAAGPAGPLFRTLVLPGAAATALISRPEISAVSFTGSTAVGREIARAAGGSLKKCVLELGGSDAYVVLADADVALAAQTCAQSRLINAGQSCISAKRFIVEKPVIREFEEKFLAVLREAKIAPLARQDLRDDLHKQVEASVAKGAKLLLGGKMPAGSGYHYPATVLTGVRPGMPAFDEELFGPVAAVIEAKDEEDAIRLANQTIYGLGSAVFTRDAAKGERIARDRLEAGSSFVNELVRSDPRLPFGGIKESGFGRELSEFGIREFTNVKTVYVR